MTNSESTEKAILWKTLERAGFLGCQFVIQIVMARILDPTDYGVLSVMLVFTNLANVFVQTGLTSALIQAKKVENEEISSVFWINFLLSATLGLLFFCAAPQIGDYYQFEFFSVPFRVLLLILPLSANTAVQIALLSRRMTFRPIMRSSLIAVVVSGTLGIVLARQNMGIWALVWQQIGYYGINSILLTVFSRWLPGPHLSIKKVTRLIQFGWKILASNVVEVAYNEIISLAVGKKYTPSVLAFYNRGKQFPQYASGIVKESLQTVLLPAFSKDQDHVDKISAIMRRYVRISMVLVWLMMGILAAAAKPLVAFMLTEKWLPCVPYLKLACIYFALVPISTVTLQAVNSIGRSDVYLRLSITKRLVALAIVLVSILSFDSMLMIAAVWTFTGLLNVAFNYNDVNKLFGYNLRQLLADTLPYILFSAAVYVVLNLILLLNISNLLTLLLQGLVGVAVYWLLLKISHVPGYVELLDFLREIFHRER